MFFQSGIEGLLPAYYMVQLKDILEAGVVDSDEATVESGAFRLLEKHVLNITNQSKEKMLK